MRLPLSQTFYDLRYFLLPILLFWLVTTITLISYGYTESFLMLNMHFHNSATDAGGMLLTHLADGVILVLLILVFTWKKDKSLLITGLILILVTGAVTQGLKNFIFEDWHRPVLALQNIKELVVLPLNPPKHHSFPSGHATSFAAGGVVFAWFWREKPFWAQMLIGGITIFLCYTRVHLGVHFLGDIFVGSMIGVLVGITLLSLIYVPLKNWVEAKTHEKLDTYTIAIIVIAVVFLLARFTSLIWTHQW